MSPAPPQPATTTVDRPVWRVGYRPDPWAWPSWRYATDGRFTGRWDDRDGTFRTLYAGATLLGCLLEVLAPLRPDPDLTIALADIDDNDPASPTTAPPGQVPRSWLDPRAAATARLTGCYCVVTDSSTIAALRPRFLTHATAFGLADFDAAALRDARPRALTQAVSSYLYATTDLDGVQFASRHGDDQSLWAIFERPSDGETSPHLTRQHVIALSESTPEIIEAFRRHRLTWSGS